MKGAALPGGGEGHLGLLDPALLLSALALLLIGTALYALMVPMLSLDMETYFLPWYAQIQRHGARALSGEYSLFTPPQLYILFLTTLLPHGLGPVAIIKLVSIAFTLAGAAVFAGLLRDVTGRPRLALLAGCAFPLVPSVALNAGWWGQCDIVCTTFLLGCFHATLRRHPALAMLLFGVAISFKLQAVFLSPYLAILLLRREIPVAHLAIPPIVYAVLMLPAWLAGRPALELATIYLMQGGHEPRLSMGAPNPWALLQQLPFVSPDVTWVGLGLAVTVVVFLAVLARAAAAEDGSVETRVVLAVFSVALAPYLLPKMHDRYFFAADVFSLLLLFLPLRLRAVPLLLQAASLSAYTVHLLQVPGGLLRVQGLLAATLALGLLGRDVWHRTARHGAAAAMDPALR
jgi:Gpi18-like mannosyltransferase